MRKRTKSYSPEFKFQIVIEAIKGEETIVQIASKYQVHPRQITMWRTQLFDEGEKIFVNKNSLKKNSEPGKEELLHLINQMKLELEFLKKKLVKKV